MRSAWASRPSASEPSLKLVDESTPSKRSTAAENRSRDRMLELVEIRRLKRAARATARATGSEFDDPADLEDLSASGPPVVGQDDEWNAWRVIRRQLRSKDERVAQTAAIKILEYRRGRPAQAGNPDGKKPVEMIFRTAFAAPPDIRCDD